MERGAPLGGLLGSAGFRRLIEIHDAQTLRISVASIHTGSRSTKRAHPAFGLLSEELAPGVGPELFHHIKQGIKANLLSPLVGCVTEGAVLSGIVEVRNTSGDSVSSQL
jgi:hypothetical protein